MGRGRTPPGAGSACCASFHAYPHQSPVPDGFFNLPAWNILGANCPPFLPFQGASPAEVRQKVNVAATPDTVTDDPEGWGTWHPASSPGAVDISTTPNRLLTTALASQAVLAPGVLSVDPATAGPLALTVALVAAPTADVAIRWAAGVTCA